MANMTFNTLSALILNYINRNDAVTIATVPTFIALAEQRLCREGESLGSETYVTGNMIAGTAVYPKPGNWRRTLSLNFGSGTNNNARNPIFQRSYEYLRTYWPNDQLTGVPLFYADYGYTSIIIGPTPDHNYPFEWSYLELPEQLSVNNQTNFWTDYTPDLLLYACLLETTPYLKNDERVPVWSSYYEKALTSYLTQSHARLLDRQSFTAADKLPTTGNKGG